MRAEICASLQDVSTLRTKNKVPAKISLQNNLLHRREIKRNYHETFVEAVYLIQAPLQLSKSLKLSVIHLLLRKSEFVEKDCLKLL